MRVVWCGRAVLLRMLRGDRCGAVLCFPHSWPRGTYASCAIGPAIRGGLSGDAIPFLSAHAVCSRAFLQLRNGASACLSHCPLLLSSVSRLPSELACPPSILPSAIISPVSRPSPSAACPVPEINALFGRFRLAGLCSSSLMSGGGH